MLSSCHSSMKSKTICLHDECYFYLTKFKRSILISVNHITTRKRAIVIHFIVIHFIVIHFIITWAVYSITLEIIFLYIYASILWQISKYFVTIQTCAQKFLFASHTHVIRIDSDCYLHLNGRARVVTTAWADHAGDIISITLCINRIPYN